MRDERYGERDEVRGKGKRDLGKRIRKSDEETWMSGEEGSPKERCMMGE